jgi:glycosyltransferase involved in cell wall biosynthesis
LEILFRLPTYVSAILEELKTADIVHVRCPAAISLIALLILIIKRRPQYRWIKYAGNWQPQKYDRRIYRLQRWLISKNCFRGVGSINGHWPDQPDHILSFTNPCLTRSEIEEGKIVTSGKNLTLPIQLLYVGRLEEAKGTRNILIIAAELHARGIPFQLNLIGDGPERKVFESLSRQLNIESQTKFVGFLPRDQLGEYYKSAHFFLLPSSAEGWPKVLSEAMAYGGVVLASDVASIPQILEESGAGFAIESDDVVAYSNQVITLIQQPGLWKKYSNRAVEYAPLFTYEHYLESVHKMFTKYWNIDLRNESNQL